MSSWPELVDAAVLGTGRAAVPPPAPVLAGLPVLVGRPAGGTSDPTRLLHLAAAASRARRAGFVPAAADRQPAPEAAPPDDRPGVSVAARRRLSDLLADGWTELVAEWARLLAGTGCRPPDVLLPALLASGSASPRLRDALGPVLGPRAAWLATANPAWAWVVASVSAGPAGLDAWTTASHRDRVDLLRRARASDPAAGRDLVVATWSQDSARDRTAFLSQLDVGLSPDDEELLNHGLADRQRDVRQTAAGFLARLPGSAFSGRAVARAAATVRVQGTAAEGQLVVRPPAGATPEMTADGLDLDPPRGTGRQAWLLRQVVAAAPARWWADYTGIPPAGLLSLATGTRWAAELVGGWTDAAIRDGHVPWLTALLGRPDAQNDTAGTALLQALPPAERNRWLTGHAGSQLFIHAVILVPAPWPAALSAAAGPRIAAVARVDPGHSPHAGRLLRAAAERLEPPTPPELNPADVHPRLAGNWAEMISTLSVRAAMRRELAEEPTP